MSARFDDKRQELVLDGQPYTITFIRDLIARSLVEKTPIPTSVEGGVFTEAMDDRAKLLTFFKCEQGRGFEAYGKAHKWSPGRTAVHFLSDYAHHLNSKYTRQELVAKVTTNLTALGMPQIVPIVSAYEALRQAVDGVAASFPAPLVDIPPIPDYEDDEHDH